MALFNKEKMERKERFKKYKMKIMICLPEELRNILENIEKDQILSKKELEKLKVAILNRQYIKKDVPLEIINKLERDENPWIKALALEEKKILEFMK